MVLPVTKKGVKADVDVGDSCRVSPRNLRHTRLTMHRHWGDVDRPEGIQTKKGWEIRTDYSGVE